MTFEQRQEEREAKLQREGKEEASFITQTHQDMIKTRWTEIPDIMKIIAKLVNNYLGPNHSLANHAYVFN